MSFESVINIIFIIVAIITYFISFLSWLIVPEFLTWHPIVMITVIILLLIKFKIIEDDQ